MRLTVFQLLFALLALVFGPGQASAMESARPASAGLEWRVAVPKAFKAAADQERKASAEPGDRNHASQSPSVDDGAEWMPAPVAGELPVAPSQAPPEWLPSAYADPLPRGLQRPPQARA